MDSLPTTERNGDAAQVLGTGHSHAEIADEDRGWRRAGEVDHGPLLGPLSGLVDAEDERFREELALIRGGTRRVQERTGYTSGGLPVGATGNSLLGAEDRGWTQYGGSEWEAYPNRVAMNRYLTERFHLAGPARNVVRTYTHFTYGTGYYPKFADKSKQEAFDKWARKVKWHQKARKIVRESFLYGASPVVLYPLTWGPNAQNVTATRAGSERRRTVATEFRVLPDSRLMDIQADPDDYERVLAYQFSRPGGESFLVAPQDVVLASTETLGAALRGPSILTPALEWIARLDKFGGSRFYLNLIRSRLPAIREFPANSAKKPGDDAVKKLPPPGSVITEHGGVTWRFPSHNVDAAGVKDDARLLVLMIASAVGLPEYLVLMDASNSNLASTLVAESPAHNMFRSHQEDFLDVFDRLLTALGWSGYTLTAPPIVARDRQAEAQAHAVLTAARIESRRTAAEAMGLDFDVEQERMAQEGPDDPPFPALDDPPRDDDDSGDAGE